MGRGGEQLGLALYSRDQSRVNSRVSSVCAATMREPPTSSAAVKRRRQVGGTLALKLTLDSGLAFGVKKRRKLRAGLLVRVSTATQDPDKQRVLLERDVALRGWVVADVYVEVGEPAHAAWHWRSELARLMRDVRAGHVDVVMVTRVDRWSRSVEHGLAAYTLLRRPRRGRRCHFVAVRERGIDTTICDPPDVRHAVIDKLNKAEAERQKLSDRAQDAADARRVAGLPNGRPFRDDIDWIMVIRMREAGASYREIAAKLGEPKSTIYDGVQRVLGAMGRPGYRRVRQRTGGREPAEAEGQ